MKNSKVKIFVAVHKDAQVYNDEVYTPIHVGKAVSDCKMNFIGDDTGDNISAKTLLIVNLQHNIGFGRMLVVNMLVFVIIGDILVKYSPKIILMYI